MPASQTLIDTLRRMTGVATDAYTINGTAHWSDADLSSILDGRVCMRLIQAEVELYPTVNASRQIVFMDGQVPIVGTLDTASATVVDFVGQPVAGATLSDDGRISFTTNQLGIGPLVSGLAYDLYGAAADVLTEWASAVKLGYDLSLDGQQASRSQRHKQLLEQAKAYRALAPIGSVTLHRSEQRQRGGRLVRDLMRSWKYWGQQ